jgi:urea transport system ATP-binding protein
VTLLELQHVTSYYGRTPILRDINMSLEEGQCITVLGRNGVGKTTLIKTIMGLTTRMTGTLKIDGEDSTALAAYERSTAGLGAIPQGRGIMPNFSVRENILLGTFARRDKQREVPSLCLELFPYLANNLDKRAGTLSGGQQQQLAIARALASDPRILLLDEPTEGIQPNVVKEIENTLIQLNRKMGIAMLLTEQHIKVARELGHRFIIMEHGRIVEQGETAALSGELVHKYLTL